MSNIRIHTRFNFRLAHVVLLLAVLVVSTGCRGTFRPERMPRMRWLVMSFDADTTPTREIRGWWFGARTIRQNPRAGAALGETVSRSLAPYPFINQFSAIDLRYYFADKREMLSKAYPNLKEPEVDRLLARVPPLDYARELGADKLLTGKIERNWLGENRTIHWWWSVLDADVQVIDVRTGKIEWQRSYSFRKHFASPETLQEKMAKRLARDLEKSYFPTLQNR